MFRGGCFLAGDGRITPILDESYDSVLKIDSDPLEQLSVHISRRSGTHNDVVVPHVLVDPWTQNGFDAYDVMG